MRTNKNRKSKICILASIAFCLPLFSAYTFAQETTPATSCTNSNICSAPSPTFKLMTSFMKEMIFAIKTVGTRDPYVGQYVSPSRFEGNTFKPPKQNLVNKLMRNITQKLQTLVAVTAIFTDARNIGGTKDFVGGMFVLFKNKVFLRDYKTLMEIDSMISDKKYELGLGGGRAARLTPANLEIFKAIIAKYGPEGEGLFTSTTKIEQDATYRQIILLMTRTNSALKTFIFSSNLRIKQFASGFTKTDLFDDSPDITISFNQQMIDAMQADYTCAQWLSKCDDTWTKFKENITKISKSFGSGSADALKTITDASKRLATAMGGGDKGVNQTDKDTAKKRNQELLRRQFGLQTSKIATGGLFGLKNYKQMILDAGGKVSDAWKATIDDLGDDNQWAAMFSGANISRQEMTKKKNDIAVAMEKIKEDRGNRHVSNRELSKEGIINILTHPQTLDVSFYSNLGTSMDSLYAQASEDSKHMELANNQDVTSTFNSVFLVMKDIVTTTIGTKRTPDSWIKNLGDACKAQCANVGGKCFY